MTSGKTTPHDVRMTVEAHPPVTADPAVGVPGGRRWWLGRVAWALALLSAVLVAAAVSGAVLAGMTFTAAVDGFVVTNAAIGIAFSSCGLMLATQRPKNPIGWLFLAAGLAHAVTAAVAPALVGGVDAGWPVWVLRLLATIGVNTWPWSIAVFLPLALLLFPDGRAPGPRWRWLGWAMIVTAPLFAGELATDPAGLVADVPAQYLVLSQARYRGLTPLWTVAELRTLLVFAATLISLIVRYRRGGEPERRQLLWLIMAVLVTVTILVPWGVFLAGPVLLLLAIPLIGVAVTVAILRYQLLDIRLVLSRAVAYLLLTAAVVATYVALVALFNSSVRRPLGLGTSVLATLLVAIGFDPVRVRLQRLVDRAVYGDRSDPVRAVSRVSARLVDADAGLVGTMEALRAALRLPFAALRGTAGEIAASGTAPQTLRTIPLTYRGDRIGDLLVGLRAGEQDLNPADRAVLELLAAPLSVAFFATSLSQELQRSRERIVNAREEERRRLRRDLHDGLGPVLTGVTLQADVIRALVPIDPSRAAELLLELRRQAGNAIEDIRRVAYGLRPPALDELGLIAALRQQITQQIDLHGAAPTAIDLDLPETTPPLPAAVESAAYRITVEAVANALRHARPRHLTVSLRIGRDLMIEVCDDAAPIDAATAWSAGVGLRSMRERAAELGGACDARPSPHGGVVTASLPLWTDHEMTR